MRRLQSAAVLLLVAIFTSETAWAAEPVTRSWSDLAQRVQPNWVLRMVLPDGVTVDGKSANFGADALTMNVVRSSNRKLHPKGQISIPRAQVRTLGVRPPRMKWRTIGTLAGIGAGAASGAAVGNAQPDFLMSANMWGLAVGAGVAIGAGVAGFFIGRAVDRRFEQVTVVP